MKNKKNRHVKNFYLSLYFTARFYIIGAVIILLFSFGHFSPVFFIIAKTSLLFLFAISLLDILMLYRIKKPIYAERTLPERLSNGDENKISLLLKNKSPISFDVRIIDEIPAQFQIRNSEIKTKLKAKDEVILGYLLKPVMRGEYHFGRLNVFISQSLSLISRRIRFDLQTMVPVYPSYIQMRKYELLAVSNRLTEAGIKKVRKLSHSLEFEQIRDYVKGDDYRTINWKATARRSQLMVNQYLDEKSQRIYCIIDMGRSMKMPFDGMTLLDYAINSSLVLSNIAMHKQDKAGLISFSNKTHTILPAERSSMQMKRILESLYNQETNFSEPNFEQLYTTIKRKINQRSLLVLFTNFEWHISLMRQIKFLRQLSRSHLLVVVLFKNTELSALIKVEAKSLDKIYLKTIAEKLSFEKRLIVKELQKYGIQCILTEPKDLSVQSINKYLELKAMGQI
ncbi:MAG: DUF58 domain-containing protein [Bacteroidetes bacterium 4572_117]|nr:MAG: DUF58 domain-containing protein [Bacteroidetes bacterium 4572_117]